MGALYLFTTGITTTRNTIPYRTKTHHTMHNAIISLLLLQRPSTFFLQSFFSLLPEHSHYPHQARYLVDHDPSLPLWQVALVVIVHMLGYYIFRSANSEKDAFRRDPEDPAVRHLRYTQSKYSVYLSVCVFVDTE